MKRVKIIFLMLCLSAFSWQMQAQQLQTVYDGKTSLPTAQGWGELRFDNTMPWEQEAKDLLASSDKLSAAIVSTALKLKVEEARDGGGYPLYSQLGWYKTRTGFSPSIGFTIEFKAKVVNSPNGAFTVSGTGGGKGFRLEFSNSRLTEHANVVDTARVLSTANTTDAYHVYRVAVAPDDKVYVWRDGALLGTLPLQPFKLDNILYDGGFEAGGTPADHGWTYTEAGKPGTLTVSNDPKYVHSGKYGLFVDKGFHRNDYVPVKPGAIYDMTAWGKVITFPEGDDHWRDLNGYHYPADDRTAYFVADRNNPDWKYYEKSGMEGGAHFSRFIVETPVGDNNDNQMAYDELHYSERITASRIPAGAVNLFPNGDFENPNARYFPEGDPRNDTCMVNPESYRWSAEAYYGGRANDSEEWFGGKGFSADHNAAPFWHPFWGARVRVQYNRQPDNDEAGNHWARGKYSLRFFNCFGYNVEYGKDFSVGQNEDRGSNSNIKTVPVELEIGKKYTFLFSYHFAKWGTDRLILVIMNGSKELFRRTINSDGYNDWKNEVLEFTTDADNHALQILTERDGSTPGVFYLDDLNLFQGELLPEDHTHIFFGKQTSFLGAEVDIEYIKMDNTGAYDQNGNLIVTHYKKGKAPLMTVWGENLQPDGPILNEYPRPQLKREGWTNLNGIWDYIGSHKAGFGTYQEMTYPGEILVPFPIESALSGIMDTEYDNQSKVSIYRRNVVITKPTDNKRVILNFGAVDWESYVFVNGQEVAHHKGGYDPFSADITDKLNAGGSQEIVVQVFDPTKGGQPSGKQYPKPQGAEYTPASGIWQTVWTETVDPTYVTNVTLTPVDNNAVKVKVEAANAAGVTATVKVLDGITQVATADVTLGAETSIAIANAKLWSPETPFLYNVEVELKKAGATTDKVTSYFGMRKIELKTLRDKPFVYLNGQPTFSYATLDHGYFPDGIYTPASYDAMRHDLSKLKELGFNAVRKFEKIEPAIWYRMADEMGMLVWQDIPAALSGTPIPELNTEDTRKANFLRETAAMTKSIHNFPSIVAWIAFNDSWGQYEGTIDHTRNTVNLLRSLNDGRLIVPESGGDHFELGDVVSAHSDQLPTLHTNAYNERASITGVTGKYNYAIGGHLWNTSAASDIKDDATYASRLTEFKNAAINLTTSGTSGLAMVQTTDVENEINGLMTYDRKIYKYAGSDSVAGKVLKESTAFMKTKITKPILKTSAQGGELWKYIAGPGELDAPTGWYSNTNFDDSSWEEGFSAFGGNMTVPFPWRTEWRGDNRGLYLRKIVNIPVLEAGDELQFTMFYDENYEFYINGVLASSNIGYVTGYKTIEINQAAKEVINYGGNNLFAIHVIQTSGGSCMDLGVLTSKQSYPITHEETTPPPVWKNIATAQDWMDIRNNLDGFYRLTADIDLYSESYAPIGNTGSPFRGYIDGQNHTVRCPAVGTETEDRVGLFGYAEGAHFVNLRIIEGYAVGNADVGVLLGRGKGITVEHVVFDEGQYKPEVWGRDHVGIVAGMLEGGALSTIKDVYVVNGKVESTDWQAAGLVGIICDTRIINSYYTGTVSITRDDRADIDNADAGGIVSRTEGGHNYFYGVMSLADSIASASGNEFIARNGGGYVVIAPTCFTRNDIKLDLLRNPSSSGQYARASASQKKDLNEFKTSYWFYHQAGWDITNVWGIPKGGGFPVFRSLEGIQFEDGASLPTVKKENDLKVYATGGNVMLETSQPTAVWIYNLQGSLVERTDINGSQTIALPAGIYIVKSAQNGAVKAVKILNR